MKNETKRRLEKAGWSVGNAGDFLGLSQAEQALIEIRFALGAQVRDTRHRTKLTQTGLAKLIGSSQSRIAKIETGNPTVSIELQMKALLTAGATPGAVFFSLARNLGKPRPDEGAATTESAPTKHREELQRRPSVRLGEIPPRTRRSPTPRSRRRAA
jgi:transcriptional regulator with XRE-family HTH domain